ncbi:conserved hypothetical protein [Pseudomonas protegens Pf-5]|uniref:Uncharacterized protein n=1 Tax=Pseudomonas fluorescens (strain ATCC BAA-477 / NRRL B-23932 / Pf-5) TaxID=220664 RepID=Q4KE26_PSEF5|nr:conserved hypothetical protein [Pseudomonas protegens Pf-5]
MCGAGFRRYGCSSRHLRLQLQLAIHFAGQAAGDEQRYQQFVQLGVDEFLDRCQVQIAARRQLGLGEGQPGFLQGLQHIAAGGGGEAAVGHPAGEVEGVLVVVAALVTLAGDAATTGAGAIGEGRAQVAVEIDDGLEGQALVDFEQVPGHFCFTAQGHFPHCQAVYFSRGAPYQPDRPRGTFLALFAA